MVSRSNVQWKMVFSASQRKGKRVHLHFLIIWRCPESITLSNSCSVFWGLHETASSGDFAVPREFSSCSLPAKRGLCQYRAGSCYRAGEIAFKRKQSLVSSTASGHLSDWTKFIWRCMQEPMQYWTFTRGVGAVLVSQTASFQACNSWLSYVRLRQEAVLGLNLWVIHEVADTSADSASLIQVFKVPLPHTSLWRAFFSEDEISKFLLFNCSQEAKALINESSSIHVFSLLPKKLTSKQKSS